MQCSFEAELVDVKGYEQFWADLWKVSGAKEKAWRAREDPWEGFIVCANEHGFLVNLKNIAEPELEIQAYIGRSYIPDDVEKQLAEGIWFLVDFTRNEDGPLMEFRFPGAYSS